ncbi:putative membrane protein [Bartonella bovis 91-4]|uniref:Putative membrane protein n=2 Tax=Bartonella bovis TaxID=155194 RepID=N6VBW0_9HYPH|nr:YrzE family protein [Bartonella bovis]ENN91290.1 putative membrane protein [Bartonella bovis 91-4]
METRIPTDTLLNPHFQEEKIVEHQRPLFYRPLSWSSIFGGLIAAISISLSFSFLLAGLGLGQIDLYSSSPFGGVLMSVGIGSIIVMFLSLAIGGFVSGYFSKNAGAAHGFLTWALLMILITLQTTLFVSGAAHMGAQTLSSVASSSKNAISSLGKEIGTLFSSSDYDILNKLLSNKDNHKIDFDKLGNDLQTALNKSNIASLDANHLRRVYEESLSDIDSVVKALLHNPSGYSVYLKKLGDRLSSRLETITADIDRDDVVRGLMNNGMTQAEAEHTADHAITVYHTARTQTEQAIKSFNQQINSLSHHLEQTAKSAQNFADQAIGTASTIGWWSFLGSLIGAVIATVCGYYGAKSRKHCCLF